jgi:hypothetical protein
MSIRKAIDAVAKELHRIDGEAREIVEEPLMVWAADDGDIDEANRLLDVALHKLVDEFGWQERKRARAKQ